MNKPIEGSGSQYFSPSSEARAAGEAGPPTEPVSVLEPIEKKAKWRQTFLLKGKGKEKADAHIEQPSPISPPVPPFSHTNSYSERLIAPPSTPVSGLATIRKQEMSDMRHVPRPTSAMDSYVVIDSPVGESDSDSFILIGREIGNIFLGEISSTPNLADTLNSSGVDPAIKTQHCIPGKLPKRHSPRRAAAVPVLAIDPTFGSRHEIDSSSSGSLTPRPRTASTASTVSARSPISHRTTLSSIPEVAIPVVPRVSSPAISARVNISPSCKTPGPNDRDTNHDPKNTQLDKVPERVSKTTPPTPSSPKVPVSIRVSLTTHEIAARLGTDGSLDISSTLGKPQLHTLLPIWNCGSADIYREYMRDGSAVAIKTMSLRFDTTTRDGNALERAARDLHAWSKCDHPNIIKLSGLVVFQDEIGIVYPWIDHGNVRQYLAGNTGEDRYRLSTQVCRGLEYLHSLGIVHSNLKGTNVLISHSGDIMLADIGSARLKGHALQDTYTNAISLRSPRWTAPEIIRSLGTYSTASDVYALGMVILEILTGKDPYHEMSDQAIFCEILFENKLPTPERPKTAIPVGNVQGDRLWELLQMCWVYAPEKRPSAATAAEIYDCSHSLMAPAPPPPRILDNLKQINFNRAPTTAQAETIVPPPRLLSPTRSRFASEDRIGEAQFYPGGSPTPRMSRRSEDYQPRSYPPEHHYVEEPESYVDPEPEVVKPAKKKSKWKQIFSRKKKGKGRAGTLVDPSPQPPLSTRTSSYPEPPPVIPASGPPASDVSTRYQLRDTGPVTDPVPPTNLFLDRMSISESRAESLRADEAAREGVAEGTMFGHRRAGGSLLSQQTRSYMDPGPPVMLIDEQTGNRVPREVSFASSHHPTADGVPVKKKRSLGGTLKRLFSRKKKVPPLVIPPPEQPVPTSHFVEIEDSHPLPAVPVQVYPTPPSAVPAVMSPRSSRSHHSVLSPTTEIVIPASTRATSPVAIPVRQGTTSSAVSSARSLHRYNTATPVSAVPVRRNTGSSVGAVPVQPNTGSSIGVVPRRRDTASSVGTGVVPRRHTGSSFGVGRRNTASSVGAAPTTRPTVVVPAPPLSRVTASESPSIRSVRGDKSWGEIRVPPEPAPARTPIISTRPAVGAGLGTGRVGLGSRPVLAPRVPRTPRTYAAPPARTPYVHVPRPIPPPPRYPTLPTTTTTSGSGGLETQVQLIVAALRDLTAEHRHDRAVAEARLEEERAWTAAERERDAELRELVMRLATSRTAGGGVRVGEFGERIVRTESE
ncbi:hypothetical protein FRC09_009987, partial [Ceratobasidium sp. 395]